MQARAEELLAYPRGRSAMVWYAHSGDDRLRPFVAGPGAPGLQRAAEAGARWVRFGEARDPAGEHARLLSHFVERFGAPPAANAEPR